MRDAIPTFYLYGEPHRHIDEDFVHVESLDDRSRPCEWSIAAHFHAELAHVFFIASGGGAVDVDDAELRLEAPCLLLIPATAIHAFRWQENSDGFVFTMSTHYAGALTDHDLTLAGLFDKPATVALGRESVVELNMLAANMMRELNWSAPGRRAAVDAAMLALLVIALRRGIADHRIASRPGAQTSLVARLRERIEERFRLREPISAHAAALGVSETALRVACAKIAGASPSQLMDQRTVLEAKRSLVYSNLAISEIAYALGFREPAHFSRFFSRLVGVSPRQYRYRPNR